MKMTKQEYNPVRKKGVFNAFLAGGLMAAAIMTGCSNPAAAKQEGMDAQTTAQAFLEAMASGDYKKVHSMEVEEYQTEDIISTFSTVFREGFEAGEEHADLFDELSAKLFARAFSNPEITRTVEDDDTAVVYYTVDGVNVTSNEQMSSAFFTASENMSAKYGQENPEEVMAVFSQENLTEEQLNAWINEKMVDLLKNDLDGFIGDVADNLTSEHMDGAITLVKEGNEWKVETVDLYQP